MKTVYILFVILGIFCNAQQKNIYKTATIVFYNVENFYDTTPSKIYDDASFTPNGERKYTSDIYTKKLNNIATVFADITNSSTENKVILPAIIGVAEIENATVLNDITNHPKLRSANYSFVHYDSRDNRGIDVALIYQPSYFKVLQSKALQIWLPEKSKFSRYTRDILWVEGWLDGELVDIYVNHWPSRYGGSKVSETARYVAAQKLKNHIDSILQLDLKRKIIVMGDFNDNPTNKSIAKFLGATEKVGGMDLYNPFYMLYKKGVGTLAFQDAWALFDQIMLSQNWMNKKQDGFFYYKSGIYDHALLTENIGKYKGYPMRTWNGLQFRNGYSDHYPVYLTLLKAF
ncbi:MAG: endonuclease/exonuclease/phosphatase [Bacteroidota bacterium]|jgi:predicted extracellular nuclease|nr:endonuclease/exonuclease/phosphatase [Bacteroidota bacterium]